MRSATTSDRKARRSVSGRRGRGRFAASILALLAAAILISVAPAAAKTPLSMLCVSPDITVALSSGTVTPHQVQCYSFPSGTAATSYPGIPPGVNVTGYFPVGATRTLLTIDTTAALPINGVGGTVTVTPHDVASYNPSTGFFTSTVYFAGMANGIPDGTQIDAIGMDGSGDLLLSFDVTINLPQFGGGTLTVKPADLVAFSGSAYTLVFDSAAAGIPDGMNLDGATMLPNTDLLMAFDEFGSIGGVDFTPTDVLEFNSGASSWLLSFNGASGDDWPDGSLIQGVWAAPATPGALVQPSSGVFYSPFFNTSTTQKFRLVNTGNAALTISSVTISSAFRVNGSTCGSTLAVGNSCVVKVDFRATHALPTMGTLSFSDSASNSPQTATLLGIGVFLFGGSLSE